MIAVVTVGYTTGRPVVPDERTSRLVLALDDDGTDPTLVAAQWVASRPGVVMPTSTKLERTDL